MNSLKDLVKDWGGFEQLIADMNNTGTIKAQHDVTLTGLSNVPRQIDVLITHKEGPYEHKILGECKYWDKPVERLHVDALLTSMRDLGASKGVIFSRKGFQSGAVEMAANNNIKLFKVRDLIDDDWGQPGRNIELVIQIFSRGFLNVIADGETTAEITNPQEFMKHGGKINLYFGLTEGDRSKTPIEKSDGTKSTLEELIDTKTMQVLREKFFSRTFTINGGQEKTFYIQNDIQFKFSTPVKVFLPGGNIIMPDFTFEMLVRIDQSLLKIDRLGAFSYALAVEDCVTNEVYLSSRKEGELARFVPKPQPTGAHPSEDVLKNGMVLKVIVQAWHDSSEARNLKNIPFDIESIKEDS